MVSVWRAVDRTTHVAITILFAIILVAMFAQVVFRYVLGSPLSWSEEVSRYMFVWLCYLGAYVAILRNAHIGVDYVTSKFSPAAVRALNVVLTLIILATLVFVAYHGVFLTLDNVAANWWTVPFLSMSLPYAAVPVGACLMMIALIRVLIALVTGQRAGPDVHDVNEAPGM
jgi:TRAP-type C4-dicarboxylate transport system permease small subunit